MVNNLSNIKSLLGHLNYIFLIFFMSYTSSNKLINLDSFETNLIKTTVFNIKFAREFAVIIISLEILIVLYLIYNRRKGLFVFAITIMIFTIYIIILRLMGLYEVCGCGGVLNGLKFQYHLGINIYLIISALFSTQTFTNSTK